MSTSTTQDLESLGQLAVRHQLPVAVVRRTLAERGIEPALRLNGTPYYGADADAALCAARAQTRREGKE